MWRRRVTGGKEASTPVQIRKSVLKRRFREGFKVAETALVWALQHRRSDPLIKLFEGKRFPRNTRREIEQAVFLFGVIHGVRSFQEHLRLEPWQRDFLDTYFTRRTHVVIQQLLTLGWAKLKPEERRTVVHFWAETPRKSSTYQEWKQNCTGVNKAAITSRAIEKMRGDWRVYLAAIESDQFIGFDLIATGRGRFRTSSKVAPMGCLIQVKSGEEDRVTIIEEDHLHHKDIGEKARRRLGRLLDVADEFSYPSRRFFPVDVIVGKTPDGVQVYDVEERASLLVIDLEKALR